MAVTNDELLQRLVVVETNVGNNAKIAAEERADVRGRINRVHAEIEKVDEKVDKIGTTINNAVQRLEGGRMAIKAIWWLGGVLIAWLAWATGLVKPLLAFLAK